MKQRKRFIAYVLTLAMLAGFYTTPAQLAHAEDLKTSDGKFSYEVSGNAVTITGYLGPRSGENRAITIPATIDGRTVTGIGYCNNDSDNTTGVFQGNYEFNTIYLPDTLEVIGDCTFCGCGLATIYVYATSGGITGDISGDASGNASGNASGDASGNGSGDASGDGSGDGSGDASGNGSGDASGNGSGDASGNGSGNGSGDASGNGSGDASGNGSGDASGNGSGDASGNSSGDASGDVSNLLYRDKTNPLPSHLSKIGARAFENSGLTTITLPVSITYIGDSAFKFCKFTSFTLPEDSHVTYIGKEVVFSGIKNVALNGTVDTIAPNAFSNISGLETFTANKVGTIGKNAFQNSTIKTFTITGSLESIGEEAFTGCGSIDTVIIHSDTPYNIKPYAFNNAAIKNIQLSEGITTIEEGTFSGCGSLNTVVLPDSLTTIEKNAFENVSTITNINIGENVNVDKEAFKGAGGSTLEALGSSNNPTIKEIIASKGGTPNPPALTPPANVVPPIVQPTVETPKAPIVKKVKLNSAKKNKSKTKVTLKWKKLSGISGYTVYVKNVAKGKKANKVSWKKVANVSAKKASYKVKLTAKQKKLLKKKGTLYFSVRAYKKANGKTYYGKYSNTKKVKK